MEGKAMHDIILAIIGCGVLNVVVTAIINGINNRKGRLKAVEDKLDKVDRRLDAINRSLEKAEKDTLRTQLLLMIADYPDNVEGIMAIGERYFGTLRGNWYATALFNGWLEDKDIAKPEWFKED